MAARMGRALLFCAMLLLLVVAWRGQHAFQFDHPRDLGGWVLLGGVVVLALARLWSSRLAQPGGPGPDEQATAASASGGWREWLAVGVVCGIGVVFRFAYFDSVPAGMNHDAAWNGMYAIYIDQGAAYTPYVSAAWGRETLFMYVVAALLPWFGNTPAPVQLAAALCGIAALLPFFFLARALFGRRVALVALTFLCVSGWHWVFSRVGWRCVLVLPFEILALLGFWRAVQTGAFRYWVLMGVGAALSINTYDGGRVVPLTLAMLFGLFFWLDLRQWRRRLRVESESDASRAPLPGGDHRSCASLRRNRLSSGSGP